MNIGRNDSCWGLMGLVLISVCLWATQATTQTCSTASDMDAATSTALQNTAKQYFDMVARGDAASLQQHAIVSLATNFSAVQGAIKDHQADFAGAQATPRPPYLLKAQGTAPLQQAEFLCGVFGSNGQTPNSAVFVIPNLPPATYGLDTLDVSTPKGPYAVTFVLSQEGTEWKLAGLYVTQPQVNGHDAQWFATQARQFKAKGETHDAWYYFLEARQLAVPVPFMSTLMTDNLYQEMQSVKPTDLPTAGPMGVTLGGKTYKMLEVFPLAVGNDLDLVARYQVPDISNTTQTFQENIAVIKALVAKYPEFRDAFAGIVARAVIASGQDYGTLLPMNEIK